MIQDIIISAGNVVFGIALLPSMFSNKKPNKFTSLSTALILFVFCGTFVTLNMEFSAIMSWVNGCFWAILFGQQLLKERKEKRNVAFLCRY
jgi:hypothetical protein